MKILFSCLALFFLTSCFNTDNSNIDTDRLNLRITMLEQRLDSLLNARGTKPFALSKKENREPVSYDRSQASWRCQATTKKGTQCKRSARSNSYCWQHGG